MTRGRITTALGCITLIAVAVTAACSHSMATSNSALGRVVPALGMLFVVSVVGVCYLQAIRELRKRNRN
jgi:hypothetical protein